MAQVVERLRSFTSDRVCRGLTPSGMPIYENSRLTGAACPWS
jgi:hypothetical protein